MRPFGRERQARKNTESQLSLENLEPRILLSTSFGSEQVIENYSWDINPQSARAADLDGDGDQDIVACTEGPKNQPSQDLDKVVWFEHQDDGGFGSEQVISTAVDRAETVRTADLNDDNNIDVLSASYHDDTVAWYENNGDGTFSDQKVVSSRVNEAKPLDTADLNGDGHTDILAASPADGWIGWYENDGTGNFGDKLSIDGATDGVKSLHASDLDLDGDADVVACYGVGTADQEKVSWWENLDNGGFGSENVIENGFFSLYSQPMQINSGDDYPDVVWAVKYWSDADSTFKEEIFWYQNDTSGGFGARQVLTDQVGEVRALDGADVDLDGDEDVVVADWNGYFWYENTDSGFGGRTEIKSNVEWARSLSTADVDGDGDSDVLTVSSKSDKISYFRNTAVGPPQIGGLSASPDPVVKPNDVTLSAMGVDDSDGSVTQVKFYLDDGDGSYDPVEDAGVGLDEDGSDGWEVTVSTQADVWKGGENTLFALAEDNDGKWSAPVSTQLTVQEVPKVDSVSETPDPVARPLDVTVTVEASDQDGEVQKVAVFEDTNSSGSYEQEHDELLKTDSDGSDGWGWTTSTAGWPLGINTFFVRAQDNDGLWSAAATSEIEVVENQPPVISNLSDSPDPVVRPNNLTLTATASDPDGTLQGVEFFVDKNDNGTIEQQEDAFLGSDSEGEDGWNWSGSTDGWPVGTHTYLARALDNAGFWSNTASTEGTVENAAPTVTSFSGNPDPVHIGEELTLTTEASDPDGDVRSVAFFYDQNGDGAAQSNELLNIDSDGSDGWQQTLQTDNLSPGNYTFLTRAVDNMGKASQVEDTSVEADYALIDSTTTNGSTASIYDTDASDGVTDPGIAQEYTRTTDASVVILARPMGEKTVYSVFQTRPFEQTDDIGIVVEGNARVNRVNWHSSIGFLLSEGNVDYAHFGGGIRGARVGGLTAPGGWQVPEDVDNDDSSGDPTGFYTPAVCKRFDSASPKAGTGILGDIVASRGLGILSARNTHIGADVRIGGTGESLLTPSTRVILRGGNLEGPLSTDGDVSALYAVSSQHRESGESYGGHIKGDIHASGDVGIVTARGGNIEGLLDVGGNVRSVKATAVSGRGGGIPGGVDAEGSLGLLSAQGGDVGSINASDIKSIKVTNGRIDGGVHAEAGGIGNVILRATGDGDVPSEEAWGIAGDLTASTSIGNISLMKRLDKASPLLAVNGGIEADSINRMTVRGGSVSGGPILATSDIGWITVIGGDMESDVHAENGNIRLLRVNSQSVQTGDGNSKSIGGSIMGDVETGGRMGILSARGGEVGNVDAGEVGRINITHGILSGDVTARSGGIDNISITKRFDKASPLLAMNGSVSAQEDIGRIVVRNGIVDLSGPGRSIYARKGIGMLYASGLLGDSDHDSKEVLVEDGNIDTMAIVGGNIQGVAADVNSDPKSDNAGNINRLLVRNADRGILDSQFSADGNLQSLLVNRAWDVEAQQWKGGRLFNTTVEARSMHVIRVRGEIGEDDSDNDQDHVYAEQGSFWIQHRNWIQVLSNESPHMMQGLSISAG